MKYDDASWHYGGEFPESSPNEYGATHIALFLKWCFSKGWAGELHLEGEPEAVEQVLSGTLAASDFFVKYCDEKLTNEDLNSEGNTFVEKYYGDDGLYLSDYAANFPEHMYVVSEQEHDYAKFEAMLDSRLESGILESGQIRPSRWWRFWE